jgi:hypothetical protein
VTLTLVVCAGLRWQRGAGRRSWRTGTCWRAGQDIFGARTQIIPRRGIVAAGGLRP